MDRVRRRVLFLCTGNSARSQMVEGLLRRWAAEDCESLFAGSKPAGFAHPLAVKARAEVGIDISGQTSKSIDDFVPLQGQPPDVVISVCVAAAAECPVIPGQVERLHWPFPDPASASGSEEERLAALRRVRVELRTTIEDYLQSSGPESGEDRPE